MRQLKNNLNIGALIIATGKIIAIGAPLKKKSQERSETMVQLKTVTLIEKLLER
ncbi:MAG: hypothetical protein P8Q48_09090 [Paracoccaceae bacterium]|nr:hypothetical protein [Paracoccaceae bacterium]MDG1370373.1 hypothetical protein [Paracoccaceae bacterium]